MSRTREAMLSWAPSRHLAGIRLTQTVQKPSPQPDAQEAAGALGAAQCVVDQAYDGRIGRPPTRDLQAADNSRQQIIEIVGSAAGKLSDGLHLLRLK
jgi:hypothetical protein